MASFRYTFQHLQHFILDLSIGLNEGVPEEYEETYPRQNFLTKEVLVVANI